MNEWDSLICSVLCKGVYWSQTFWFAHIIKSVLLIFDWIKKAFKIYYRKYWQPFCFRPFCLRWQLSGFQHIHFFFTFNTNMSERIQLDEVKLFASIKGRTLYVMKRTPYTVIDRHHCCVIFSVSYHH